jgi:hypothetical protein
MFERVLKSVPMETSAVLTIELSRNERKRPRQRLESGQKTGFDFF